MDQITEPSRWEKEITLFHELLVDPKGQAIVIVGPEKSGKSTLLRNMVMFSEKAEGFHCESQILHTGPNDNYTDVLRKIGERHSGKLTFLESGSILERLSYSVKEFGDLHRRGEIQIIQASVPLSKMFGYSTALRSATQGRGTFTMHFSHYDRSLDPPKVL